MYSLIFIKKNYCGEYALNNVYNYISNNCKKEYQGYVNISAYPVIEMEKLKRQYNETGDSQLIHFIVLFGRKYGFTAEMAYSFALKVVSEMEQYQLYYGLHTDTQCPHVHFMVNSVAMNGERIDRAALENYVRSVCEAVKVKVQNNSHILYH